jgi:hypothetical protein
MVALKEVVASYSIKVDDGPLKNLQLQLVKTEQAVKKTGAALSKGLDVDQFGRGIAVLAAGTAAVGFAAVKMASDVEETNNVVQQTFKDSADSVFDWSKDAAKAMQRSEYDLQRYAGNVGAFLAPVFAGTGKDITGISKQVSELAVDLASFYNLNDQEAMLALQSGLSGETEAVRRFGINLADERLDRLNKEINGQQSIYNKLGLREKTELRLLAILKDTADKQGDAERTAGSWANQMKALEADYKKVTVELGTALLPLAKEYLATFRGVSATLVEHKKFFQEHVGSFESMAYFLGISAAAWAWIKISAEKTALATAGHLAVLAGIWLVVDDIVHFARDQNSVIGDTLELLAGEKVLWEDITAAAGAFFEQNARALKREKALRERDTATLAAMDAEEAEFGPTPLASRAQREKTMAPLRAVEAGNLDQYIKAREAVDGRPRSQAQLDAWVSDFKRQRKQHVTANPKDTNATDIAEWGQDPRSRMAPGPARIDNFQVRPSEPTFPMVGPKIPLYPRIPAANKSASAPAAPAAKPIEVNVNASGYGATEVAGMIVKEITRALAPLLEGAGT